MQKLAHTNKDLYNVVPGLCFGCCLFGGHIIFAYKKYSRQVEKLEPLCWSVAV